MTGSENLWAFLYPQKANPSEEGPSVTPDDCNFGSGEALLVKTRTSARYTLLESSVRAGTQSLSDKNRKNQGL